MKKHIIAIVATVGVLASNLCLVGCGGGGGVVTPEPPVQPPPPPAVITKPVVALSYQNKNQIDTDNVQLPAFRLLRDTHGWTFSATETSAGCNTPGCSVGVVNDRSLAFGDFFQDGSYSAFISTWRRTGVHDSYLKIKPIVDAPNKVYFVKFINGKWVDKTSTLLPNEADRYTCVSHSYTAVTDFNKDGKPDLFVSCHGIDYSFGPGDTISGQSIEQLLPTTWRSILFNKQIVYLSQTDGTYKRIETADEIYGHHASTADIDGDGNVDVATTNASWGNANPYEDHRPFFLMGRGDGTFTKNYSRMPARVVTDVGSRIHIYWTYLIPTENGRVDLIAVGDKVAWYKNPGNGDFSNVAPTYLPLEVGYQATPLDIIYKDGNFYVNHSGGDWPGVMRIKKVNAQTLTVTQLYSLDRDPGMSEGAISPQLKITKDNKFLAPFVAGCQREPTDPLFSTSKCSIKIPLN
jgi:hypothetical protein